MLPPGGICPRSWMIGRPAFFALLLSALFMLASVSPSRAADPASVATISLGTGYATAGGDFWSAPAIGDSLEILGIVSGFAGSLASAGVSGTEYSYVITGLDLSGLVLWDDWRTGRGGTAYEYAGGRLDIFADTPDVDFTAPATLRDGTLFLSGGIASFWVADGKLLFQVRWTAGSEIGLVSDASGGLDGGAECSFGTQVPSALSSLGYVAATGGGELKVWVRVPVESSTWGGIKALYSGH